MNGRFLVLSLLPLLAHCGDGEASAGCLSSRSCGAGTECVWTGSGVEPSCMPQCDLHSQCAAGELCLVQPSPTQNAELLFASTCLAASQEPFADGVACQERDLEACEAKPGCNLHLGSKLHLQQRCVEDPTPVACLPIGVVCNPSFTLGEGANDELFRFPTWCSPRSLSPVDLSADHPLSGELLGVEPDVWSWPTCPGDSVNADGDAKASVTLGI